MRCTSDEQRWQRLLARVREEDRPGIGYAPIRAATEELTGRLREEIERAGRDRAPARTLLLFRPEDVALQRFFAGGAPSARSSPRWSPRCGRGR